MYQLDLPKQKNQPKNQSFKEYKILVGDFLVIEKQQVFLLIDFSGCCSFSIMVISFYPTYIGIVFL
ncbi:MAG: hypothetical protein Q4G16_12365 [Cruoricaptor ignavus]|nr:hypothetical protein [Cruoricaptor ignavus]